MIIRAWNYSDTVNNTANFPRQAMAYDVFSQTQFKLQKPIFFIRGDRQDCWYLLIRDWRFYSTESPSRPMFFVFFRSQFPAFGIYSFARPRPRDFLQIFRRAGEKVLTGAPPYIDSGSP